MTNINKKQELLLNHAYHLHHHVSEYARNTLAYTTLTIGGAIVALASFLFQRPYGEGAPTLINAILYNLLGYLLIALACLLVGWTLAFLQMYMCAWHEKLTTLQNKENTGWIKRLSNLQSFCEYTSILLMIVSLGFTIYPGYQAYNTLKAFYTPQSPDLTKSTPKN